MKKKKIQIASLILTGFIILMLVMIAPAEAITLGIKSETSEAKPHQNVNFYAYVDLHEDDKLFESAQMKIVMYNRDGFKNYTCYFDIWGHETSSCDNLDVKLVKKTTKNIGYGYGYGYGFGEDGQGNIGREATNFDNEQQDYFGSQPKSGYDEYTTRIGNKAEFVYQVQWKAPLVTKTTYYTMSMMTFVTDGEKEFQYLTYEKNKKKIKVLAKKGDQDKDGVYDTIDMCPNTEVPEDVPTKELGVNRYAIMTGTHDGKYAVFDTKIQKKKSTSIIQSDYTTEDTKGCSCDQILDKKKFSSWTKGLYKYGCTEGVLKDWIKQKK